MREHERTGRRMIATGAVVLVVTLAALGAAKHALVGREEASEREQSRRALEATVVRAVRTCLSSSQDATRLAVDLTPSGEFEQAAARAFAPLPATSDGDAGVDEAATRTSGGQGGPHGPTAAERMLEETERSGDPRLLRAWVNLMLVADDPVVRLRAAVRGALLDDEAAGGPPASGSTPGPRVTRDWRVDARTPAELTDTAEAVLLGVRAGDAAAIDRAWQAVGTRDEDRAVAMLVNWPPHFAAGDPCAITRQLRRVCRWLDDRAVVARFAQTLPVRDLSAPGFSPLPRARFAVLADGSWLEGSERDGGGWRYVHHADRKGLDSLARALLATGVRLVPQDRADVFHFDQSVPIDVGWAAIWMEPPSTSARGTLLATGLAVAAAAALFAFAFFARAVRRETAAAAARADFVATASHELRTPIAVMRTAAETLLAGRAPRDEDRATLLRAVLRESERLSSLVGNLLDFSRMDAGTRRYSFRETDPVALVQDTVQRTASAFAGTGFRVEVDSEPSVGPFRADPDALGAALANLLDNAAKFRGASDHAVVRVRGDADAVTIDVEDRGIGIAAADRAHVFERFFRASDPRVRETRGSGIGLALVRHAVEAHHGTIEIRDTPGGGTTFRIVLPKRGDPA